MKKFIIYLGIFVIVSGSAYADEEDYPFSEFAADVGAGVMIAQCENDPQCSKVAPAMTFISFTIFCIMAGCGCINLEEEDHRSSKKTAKRVGSVGLGYAIGKSF